VTKKPGAAMIVAAVNAVSCPANVNAAMGPILPSEADAARACRTSSTRNGGVGGREARVRIHACAFGRLAAPALDLALEVTLDLA
jgi:hypothetical protein